MGVGANQACHRRGRAGLDHLGNGVMWSRFWVVPDDLDEKVKKWATRVKLDLQRLMIYGHDVRETKNRLPLLRSPSRVDARAMKQYTQTVEEELSNHILCQRNSP